MSQRVTKAFLLGAGLGTRLLPLTGVLPKPLIPVFHRPLVHYALDHCLAAGISEFAINTHHLPEAWHDAFPSGEYRGAPIAFFHEPELLETGGGIKNIEAWIGGDTILVYNADILTDLALDRLLADHAASRAVATLALRNEGPALHIAVDGMRVVDIRHQLGIAPGTHQFTGIYCVGPELLDRLPPNEKISVIPAFLELARDGLLAASFHNDTLWLDLGTHEAYLDAHREDSPVAPLPENWIHPGSSIDPTARVVRSVVDAGCVIGAGAVIRDSVLWPETQVAPGAQLTNCIVYSSTPATGTRHKADL